MAEKPESERMEQLKARLDAARKTVDPAPRMEDHHSAAHQAWRMVTELVTGIIIGLGIGYGIDALFGTMPVFLVLFVLLGFAAGVRVMLRTAQEVQRDQVARAAAGGEGERRGD